MDKNCATLSGECLTTENIERLSKEFLFMISIQNRATGKYEEFVFSNNYDYALSIEEYHTENITGFNTYIGVCGEIKNVIKSGETYHVEFEKFCREFNEGNLPIEIECFMKECRLYGYVVEYPNKDMTCFYNEEQDFLDEISMAQELENEYKAWVFDREIA